MPNGGPSNLYYPVVDHLGSTVGIMDSAGALVSSQQYWPYGEARDAHLSPPQPMVTEADKLYTGQQIEDGDSALGLYNYKARFYSTTLGRFLSVDPLAPAAGDPQAWNSYAYVRNNPLRHVDPTGMCIPDDDGPRGCGLDPVSSSSSSSGECNDLCRCLDNPVACGALAAAAISTVGGGAGTDIIGGCIALVGPWGCAAGGVVAIGTTVYLLFPDEVNAVVGTLLSDDRIDPEEAAGRQAYEEEVKGLADVAETMKKNGVDEETVARHVHDERDAIKVKYRQLMPRDRVKEIEARNTERYGNPLGPTIEHLREVQGKTWAEIIESAARPGGEDLGY